MLKRRRVIGKNARDINKHNSQKGSLLRSFFIHILVDKLDYLLFVLLFRLATFSTQTENTYLYTITGSACAGSAQFGLSSKC